MVALPGGLTVLRVTVQVALAFKRVVLQNFIS